MTHRRRLWRWLWDGPYRSFYAITGAATFAWLQVATVLAEIDAGLGAGWAAMGGFVARFLAAGLINMVAGTIWPVSWIHEMSPVLGVAAAVAALVVWIGGRITLAILDRPPAS